MLDKNTFVLFEPTEQITHSNGNQDTLCRVVATDFESPQIMLENLQEGGVDIEALPKSRGRNRSFHSMNGLGDKYDRIFKNQNPQNN